MSEKVYYELDTEFGPIYYYTVASFEKYAPYEFFTQTEGVFGYGTISFGDAKFETTHRDLEGTIRNEYAHKLRPYEFLMKVAPYLKDKETKQAKMLEVTDVFDRKAKGLGNDRPISKEPDVSNEQLDNVAAKLLTLYTKNK